MMKHLTLTLAAVFALSTSSTAACRNEHLPALHAAVLHGMTAVVLDLANDAQQLSAQHPKKIELVGDHNTEYIGTNLTPLHIAIFTGNGPLTTMLLEAGANRTITAHIQERWGANSWNISPIALCYEQPTRWADEKVSLIKNRSSMQKIVENWCMHARNKLLVREVIQDVKVLVRSLVRQFSSR